MESLKHLKSFVCSAELRSFSAAARRLGLTPAAVSRNVAQLEGNLGVRLFERSTRRLGLTEAGEQFFAHVAPALDSVQSAIAEATQRRGQPAGTLGLSVAPGFGMRYVLPLLPGFLARYPGIKPDWRFDNLRTDFAAPGIDVAIGGGFTLSPGVVARPLVPVHLVVVAAPAFVDRLGRRITRATRPADLTEVDGVVLRSPQSGRVAEILLRDRGAHQEVLPLRPRVILNDPDAVCQAVLLGLGAALLSLPHALPHLESGALQRLLPDWWADAGHVSVYFSRSRLLPAKTRAFVDYLFEQFTTADIAKRLSADAAVRP